MGRRRFDLLEVVLISAFVSVTTAAIASYRSPDVRDAIALGRQGAQELSSLALTYGPAHASQFAEEWIVRDFFKDRRDGVFVDVGANDYRRDSTTYYLETALGWHGIAVDAQREYAAGYQQYRPRTEYFTLFVSDQTDATADLYIPKNRPLNASGTREAVDVGDGVPVEARVVPTIRLDDLLARAGVDRVDFVSMDIELAEPKALAGFDIERFRPALVCIEAHPVVRQAILDYFFGHGYVVVGKYLRADAENLYFAPLHPQGR